MHPVPEFRQDQNVNVQNTICCVQKKLGEGGFGKVFLVKSEAGVEMALKVVIRNSSSEREKKNLVNVSSSQYVIKLLLSAIQGNLEYFLFELVGRDVRAALDDNGSKGLPVRKVQSVLECGLKG